MAITVAAPSSRALSIANWPTGPAPHTATTSPAMDVAHLGAHVAGRQDVGQEQHLLVRQVGLDLAAGRRRRTARGRTRPGRPRTHRSGASSRRCRPAGGRTSSRRGRRSGCCSRSTSTARPGRPRRRRRRWGTARRPGRRPAARPVRHVRPDLDDLAHELVTQDVALLHRRHVAVDQVEVRPADRGRRHFTIASRRLRMLGSGTSWTSTALRPDPTGGPHRTPALAGPESSASSSRLRGRAGCCGNS